MDNCNCKSFKKAPLCKTKDGLTIVIIPAQSGDSKGVFAPKLGDYKNTLVKYMADSKVFAYDKDGNYTFIGATDVEGVTIDDELSLSSTNAVQNKVVTKAINDTNGRIDDADSALADEITNREAADFNLQNNIDNEAITRGNNDNTLQGNIDAEVLARQTADGILQGNIDAEVLARSNAISGIETKINRALLSDLIMNADANSVTFTEQKVNPLTGEITTEQDVIPTASTTTAGTISAAEYQSILDSEELTQAILSGAVALSGIPANPTQAELSNAWLSATGREEVINRASIFDEDNGLIWTYYTNSALWYSATASITLDNFTNSTPGIILGSTTDGKVSANNDGTGSVSGWSTVKNDITSLQTNKADASSLATVATSGSYNDLLNKPTIPTVNNATLTIQKNGTDVSTFTANSASNVTANIAVPTKTSELTNNSNFVSDASYVHTDNNFTNTLKTKLDGIAAGAEVNVQANWTQTNTSADDYIKNKPSLAAVATSGSYNDLTNKPTIPTINNGTLTIQKNGTSVATFTANQAGNATANITVPTKTSDLTNNSNFVADASYVHTDNNFTTTLKNKLDGIASGAEVNVQADWNVSDSTSDAFIKNKPTIPTVNNATLTIQKNGVNVQTFTANSSSNKTANITVPEITMTTTDPGEGAALAANNFIAVYE